MTYLEGLKNMITSNWLRFGHQLSEQWDKLSDQYDATNYPKDYGSYTQSDHWKAFRAMVIEDKGKCDVCDDIYEPTAYFVVHHHHYNSLGEEKSEDVALLCELCHIMVHGVSSLPMDSYARRYMKGCADEMGYELTELDSVETELVNTKDVIHKAIAQNDYLTDRERTFNAFKLSRDIICEFLNFASVIAKLARKDWVNDSSFAEATDRCTTRFTQMESEPGIRGQMIYYLAESLWSDVFRILEGSTYYDLRCLEELKTLLLAKELPNERTN